MIDVESFYVRYGPMVLRRCRRMLKNEQSALDVMHEVFLKVLSRKKKLTADYPSALLYRIATNVCLNKIRNDKQHSLNKYLDILCNTSFFENQNEDSDLILLEYIIENERNTTRQIAVLYVINGMTIKEIAEVLKLSISGVHKHLDKLRRKIRDREKSDE
ncbi:MAG: sigma-70 family RNA polymerase sigma factor [Candidatus Aminicenantes bacterium]|nr:sigma-70 family RNA polymerase sigma factor [Candidatus Aminicenantes bacterium]